MRAEMYNIKYDTSLWNIENKYKLLNILSKIYISPFQYIIIIIIFFLILFNFYSIIKLLNYCNVFVLNRLKDNLKIPTTDEEAKELAQKGNTSNDEYVDVDVQCDNILK